MNKIDDTEKYYSKFLVSDIKNKKKLQEHVLYQLFKKPKNDIIAPEIISPEDHKPNQIHQADLLYLPVDEGYMYGLTVVDTGSRLTDCEPMKDKKALTTLNAIKKIYDRGIIKIPEISLEVDAGSEFKNIFSKYFKDKSINIRIAQTGRSRQQGLVESRNGSIANILLKRMVAEELLLKKNQLNGFIIYQN